MTRVCLITTGQPSTNPRLVKEADALSAAGYDVRVICAHWAKWADVTDKELLASKLWKDSVKYVGGKLNSGELGYLWSRARHGVSRRFPGLVGANWSLSRVLPELIECARATPAELYIAHNLGALPAAVAAAQSLDAAVGFDAEDFHAGMSTDQAENDFAVTVERENLPFCDYLTAASPGIADAYVRQYGVVQPVSILNVFPVSDRPARFREGQSDEPLTLYWFSQTIGVGRGLEDVVRAMGRLPGRKIQLHLRGIWSEGYRSKLFELARSCNVSPESIVSYGPSSPDEMVRLAANFDVGLALETRDTINHDICISNKIFTYMLAGCAIAATNTHGQRMILTENSETGFVYRSGDDESLAQALKLWLDNREALMSARRASWAAGEQKYNWDLEKERFLSVVKSVSDVRYALAFR